MILYFSGTGNSRYAAEIIQSVTGDELHSMNDLIKKEKKAVLKSEKPLVFVCPVYAWRMPRVVEKLIKDSFFEGCVKAYFVLTCGSESGNAVRYTQKLCMYKGLEFMGFRSVPMPENYIAIYEAPDKATAETEIKRAVFQIYEIAHIIKDNYKLTQDAVTIKGKFLSGAVNPVFYKFVVKAEGFYSTDDCISCGKCVNVCPLNNVSLQDGRPKWGNRCTHCMACICMCPKEAIEYKNKTQGKQRYYLDSSYK